MDKTGKLHLIDQGIDNMTDLVELSDQSLLLNLQTRYAQKLIYTYIGSILISINPYTELGIYDTKRIQSYQNKSLHDMPPHLFGIGEINFSKMMMENENQVIVISGESGAGKTESFKRLLKYFAHVSGGSKLSKNSSSPLTHDIATRILDSTPLLESFGNAQTIRNDNSSRFGKYVEIFFENGTICGSRITNYLLEKSRIVNINSKERGYHIFYEILQGLDSFSKSQYHFKEIKDYAYLNKTQNFHVKDRNDAMNLTEFMDQWGSLGMTNEDLDVTMRILSAVIHLGNIKFMEEQEVSYLVEIENIGIVAKMLKIDRDSLKHCLTMKTTETVKDASSSPLNVEQSINYRDTFAKHLYSELFNWIISKVNDALNQTAQRPQRRASVFDKSLLLPTSNLKCIAMLDIYGFENFPENSLEQLCINYANETLQQFFNRYVFELEQAEYKQEGISWHYISYPDNQPIIDLLSAKPNGIIQILNDECSIPQGSDESFLTKCHNVHSKNPNYEKPKRQHLSQFVIHHFAGSISYTVTGFLEKNRDVLRKEILNVIEHSDVEEIATIFRKKREQQQKNPIAKARTPAVMGDFQNSLNTLLTKMKTCQPWFIRCLKPNNKKEAMNFDNDIVMDQMKYTGILETVKIRKSGFPIRILFSVFLSRFYLLVTKEIRRSSKADQQDACLALMIKFKGQRGKHFEIGKTKLFLKESFARHLESQVRIIRNRSAIIIQRKWRAYWKIKLLIIQNLAATRIQAAVRGFLDRRRIRNLRRGIVKLQAYVRMQLTRRRFLEEHPEFLKFVHTSNKELPDSSKMTAYRLPKIENPKKHRKPKKRNLGNTFNYDLLKIPIELAFILEKSTGSHAQYCNMPEAENIIQTGRAQHLWNREDYKLPEDVDLYLLENFLDEHGNNVSLEPKPRPITIPYLSESVSSDETENALIAHKLILRILYANSMPWLHRFLTTSYLLFLATKSVELQKEIAIQIIAETIPHKSFKSRFESDNEDQRLMKSWALLGNFLSFIIPSPDIYNHILKFVSDSFGIDQAVTCQEKLLQLSSSGIASIPRIFPISNLEYRANQRGAKTCLNVIHPDEKSNSVHLNSFTIAEDMASHSLCFRMNRFKLIKGFSISVVLPDKVIDCGGQNYLLDVITGLELPQHWSEITGRELDKHFLVSRRHSQKSDFGDLPTRGFIKNVTKSNINPAASKNMSTVNSLHSMDSWVEKVFDSSFRHEDTASIPIENYIHGLEDDLKQQQIRQTHPTIPRNLVGSSSNPNLAMSGNQGAPFVFDYNAYPRPASSTLYFPAAANDFELTQDPIYLQEQLNVVQLENKVIQSSIERELLQNRLQKIQHQRLMQNAVLSTSIPHQYPQRFHQVPSYSNPPMINQPMMNPYYNQYTNSSIYQIPQTEQVPMNGYNPNHYMNGQEDFRNYQTLHPQQLSKSDHSNQSVLSNEHNQNNKTFFQTQVHNDSPTISAIPLTPQRSKSPMPPPPPPPPPIGSPSLDNFDSIQNEGILSSQHENKNARIRKKSVVRYSEVGAPSDTIVDDNSVLPAVLEHEKRKSYQRAAEVPKVNVTNRAAFLENFFKEKPLMNSNSIVPGKKRTAPQAPAIEIDDGQINAINLLASMNNTKLIPRPIMKSKGKSEVVPAKRKSLLNKKEVSLIEEISYENQLPRTSLDHADSTDFEQIKPEIQVPNLTISEPIKSQKIARKYVSTKNAIILCGLPDMRYYTYQKTQWFLLLKREIYLPNEIQSTSMLNPMIFCQIWRDLVEFPCIRWIRNEKERLLSILGDVHVTKDINSILAVPANVMLQVINEAQKCELYFSRFFPIQWVTTSELGGICYWLAISHSGIRFVEQNSRIANFDLNVVSHVGYSNVVKVICKGTDLYNNPQLLTITTKSQKKFKMRTVQAAQARLLILEFLTQQDLAKSTGTINLAANNDIFLNKGKKKRMLLQENSPFSDSGTMMLGVNNERILFQKSDQVVKPKSENQQHYEMVKKEGNLIEFVYNFSKYKDRKQIENVVLRWQQEQITEPILPFLNSGVFKVALAIYRSLLLLSKDFSYNQNSHSVENATFVLKNLLQNMELKEEVILQIFKQINGNSVLDGRNYLWNLLSIIIIFVGPSQRMQPYLLEHLNQIVKNAKNQDQHLAAYALKNYKLCIKYGPRKELPLDGEFKQLMEGIRDVNVSVNMATEIIPFNVSYHSPVEEVVSTICQSINVTSQIEITDFSLAVMETNKNNIPTHPIDYLKGDLYLFDVINYLTKQNRLNFKFSFVRMSWIMPLQLDYRSPKFINLIFTQLSKEIVNGDWVNADVEFANIAKIAYLNMRGQGFEKPKNEEVLKNILPNRLFDHKKKTTFKKKIVKMINQEAESFPNHQNLQQLEFQKKFLELVEKLPRFGHISYPVTDMKPLVKSGHGSINFNDTSIFFLDEGSQQPMIKFQISEFNSFVKIIESTRNISFKINYKYNEEIQFSCINVTELSCVLNQYIEYKNLTPTSRH